MQTLTNEGSEVSKYADTSELRFGSVQNLVLELETRPRTEQFRSHIMEYLLESIDVPSGCVSDLCTCM